LEDLYLEDLCFLDLLDLEDLCFLERDLEDLCLDLFLVRLEDLVLDLDSEESLEYESQSDDPLLDLESDLDLDLDLVLDLDLDEECDLFPLVSFLNGLNCLGRTISGVAFEILRYLFLIG